MRTQTIQLALQRTVEFYRQKEISGQEFGRSLSDEQKCLFENSRCDSQSDISGILKYTATILGVDFADIRGRFGEEFFGLCLEENERVLRALGGNLQDFFNGFDALLEHIRTSCGRRASSEAPSFLCKDAPQESDETNAESNVGRTLLLHCFNPDPTVGVAMPGLIRAAARRIYQSDVLVEEAPPTWLHTANEDGELSADSSPSSSPSPPSSSSPACLSFLIREVRTQPASSSSHSASASRQLSRSPLDLRIGLSTFCRAFPFHLVLGPNMEVLQVGEGLRKQAKSDPHRTLTFSNSFELVSPRIPCSFQNILLRLSTPFTIRTRPDGSALDSREKLMELKGQMLHLPESNSIMFLGSPRVDRLEELMGRGLHLSDIPIHDATRDVILVGEQAKAQDGLKKRMDKLKATLEKTHQALEEEKRRTVDLLYSIFPGDVAQRLWQGLPVQAKKFDDVTMLFSDIVGFTAVCAQCTPMQVISMLNELYTRFDYQCGILDVYKIETIGDAYCSLKWPVRRLLRDDRAFTFIPRSRQELPDNFPKEIPGICYFLEAGKTQSHASLTSTRSAPIRKVSYNIGTMFLRETSL
ncbi:guanylate cyclase soluble subunit alpha-2 [Garra rufa]|uniref:guanylate cyclase soluble subunit alpha-2 n=1 Tax=Garra rufa TaxID=137080 RepID=UPI003CCEB031